jgi:GTP-binding protein Era
MTIEPEHRSTPTRAGYVTLVGRPNAGKSTLLNRLIGEHLSIVTPRAQTTWQRVTGILTLDDTQLVFLDTPGLLDPRDLLQRAMLSAAREAVEEADVIVLVVDATRSPGREETARIEATLERARAPLHAAINKTDLAPGPSIARWRAWLESSTPARLYEISALDGTGVEDLLDAVRADLPPGPFLYPPDDIASDPVRFFVAELVRETIFEQYREEIPYAAYCHVEEMREDQDPVYVGVHIYVERPSQKKVLVGAGGSAVRELGRASRLKIEHFLGRRVYLDLWVKPLKAWRRNRAHLGKLGFRVPHDDDSHDS